MGMGMMMGGLNRGGSVRRDAGGGVTDPSGGLSLLQQIMAMQRQAPPAQLPPKLDLTPPKSQGGSGQSGSGGGGQGKNPMKQLGDKSQSSISDSLNQDQQSLDTSTNDLGDMGGSAGDMGGGGMDMGGGDFGGGKHTGGAVRKHFDAGGTALAQYNSLFNSGGLSGKGSTSPGTVTAPIVATPVGATGSTSPGTASPAAAPTNSGAPISNPGWQSGLNVQAPTIPVSQAQMPNIPVAQATMPNVPVAQAQPIYNQQSIAAASAVPTTAATPAPTPTPTPAPTPAPTPTPTPTSTPAPDYSTMEQVMGFPIYLDKATNTLWNKDTGQPLPKSSGGAVHGFASGGTASTDSKTSPSSSSGASNLSSAMSGASDTLDNNLASAISDPKNGQSNYQQMMQGGVGNIPGVGSYNSMPKLGNLNVSMPNIPMPQVGTGAINAAMPTVPWPYAPTAQSSGGKGGKHAGGAVRSPFANGGHVRHFDSGGTATTNGKGSNGYDFNFANNYSPPPVWTPPAPVQTPAATTTPAGSTSPTPATPPSNGNNNGSLGGSTSGKGSNNVSAQNSALGQGFDMFDQSGASGQALASAAANAAGNTSYGGSADPRYSGSLGGSTSGKGSNNVSAQNSASGGYARGGKALHRDDGGDADFGGDDDYGGDTDFGGPDQSVTSPGAQQQNLSDLSNLFKNSIGGSGDSNPTQAAPIGGQDVSPTDNPIGAVNLPQNMQQPSGTSILDQINNWADPAKNDGLSPADRLVNWLDKQNGNPPTNPGNAANAEALSNTGGIYNASQAALNPQGLPEQQAPKAPEIPIPAPSMPQQGFGVLGPQGADQNQDQVSKAGLFGVQNHPQQAPQPVSDPSNIQAITTQAQRERGPDGYGKRMNGTLSINGHDYPFVTGGAGRGSAPYGTYDIGDAQRNTYLNPRHEGNTAYPLSDVDDPYTKNDSDPKRTGLFIHPGNNASQGCIAIPHDKWDSFEKDMRSVGPKTITIAPPGANNGPSDQQSGPRNISGPLESGAKDPTQGVSNISPDTNGSHSYGNLGLNSQQGASAWDFQKQYGSQFNLTAKPGTPEFDQQWKDAASKDPKGLVAAENEYWKNNIAAPAQEQLTRLGVPEEYAKDPRVLTYMADRSVQQGPNSTLNHGQRILDAAKNSNNSEEFLQNLSESDKQHLPQDFRTYLSQNPGNVNGLVNRIDNRLKDSLGVNSTPITGPLKQAGNAVETGVRTAVDNVKQTLSQGYNQDGRQPQYPYQDRQDQQAGGLLSHVFGNGFNPFNLSPQQRQAMFRAGAIMYSTGDVGRGALAYQDIMHGGSGMPQKDGNWQPMNAEDGHTVLMNSKTGDIKELPDQYRKLTKQGSGNGGGVFEIKRQAYLAAHPDDVEGALTYASGHKTMSDAEIQKSAINFAQKDAQNQGIIGDKYQDFVQQRVKFYVDALSKAQSSHAGASPQPQQGQPQGQQQQQPQLKKDPGAFAQAQAAIKSGAPRDAVIKRLQDNGIDPSGL